MAVLQLSVVLLMCCLSFTSSAPSPLFFGHKHHKHVIIHVPYNVHTVHHHHVEKVPIYKHIPYPVYKHIPVYKEVHVPVVKEVHVPVHHEPEYKGWSSSGWW